MIFFFDFLIKLTNHLPGTKHLNDTNLSIFELIESRGFRYESHFVTTNNGYILQLVRIINPYIQQNQSNHELLKPIFLQHGFQTNGRQWLVNRNGHLDPNGKYYELNPDNEKELIYDNQTNVCGSLGFVLSNRGYDVWLANYRGSFYSKNHTTLDIHSEEFWSFSIDDLVDDLALLIDYVCAKTNQKSITYVGHSQGSFMIYALLAKHVDFSEKIQPVITLAPVVYITSMRFLLVKLTPLKMTESLLRKNAFEVVGNRKLMIFTNNICENFFIRHLCHLYLKALSGLSTDETYNYRAGIYMNNMMTGSSSWNFAQFLQILMSNDGQPRYFDFKDDELNYKHYYDYYYQNNNDIIIHKNEKISPPIYNISQINSKHLAIIYSPNDELNVLEDIQTLKKNLNVKLIDYYELPSNMSHMGMIWSKDAGRLVNGRILKILSQYS